MIDLAILALRWSLLPLALAVMAYCAPGVWRFASGHQSLSQTNRAAWFFAALAALTAQSYYLGINPSLLLLFSLLALNVGLGLQAWMLRRAQQDGAHAFEPMFDRPDLALPLVELYHVNPQAALGLAQEARLLFALSKTQAGTDE